MSLRNELSNLEKEEIVRVMNKQTDLESNPGLFRKLKDSIKTPQKLSEKSSKLFILEKLEEEFPEWVKIHWI